VLFRREDFQNYFDMIPFCCELVFSSYPFFSHKKEVSQLWFVEILENVWKEKLLAINYCGEKEKVWKILMKNIELNLRI
jgi:hypothetical protein